MSISIYFSNASVTNVFVNTQVYKTQTNGCKNCVSLKEIIIF